MNPSAIDQMKAKGVSTEDAHLMHDLTKLAVFEANRTLQEIAERAPPELTISIYIGSLGSLAAMLKRLAPETFAAIAATDTADMRGDGMTVDMGKLNVDD